MNNDTDNSMESVEDNIHVLILGCGPAGLAAAYSLCYKKVRATVFEKSSTIGGISRTEKLGDYYFDLGGHRFFSKNRAINKIWKDLLGTDFLSRSRKSRIYFRKKFFDYPLKPINALSNLGLINSFFILTSYLYAKIHPVTDETTLEQWVTNRFGKRLYEIFFKTYTEKVWGIPCTAIAADWAAQRIKGLSLLKAIKNSIIPSHNKIKTLTDSFHYPKYGPGMMWEAMAEKSISRGSNIRLNSGVQKIFHDKEQITAIEVFENGEKRRIDGSHFISSLPIRELLLNMHPAVPDAILQEANKLQYRDFITIALIIDKKNLFQDNWIYIHDPDVKVGRIQNFKNWSPWLVPDQDKTCLGMEYFCNEGDSIWNMQDEELRNIATRELVSLELINNEAIEGYKVVRVPKAYPIYDANYKNSIAVIQKFLNGFKNLQLIGRNGMHRYNNMDHSMLTGMLAAENICSDTKSENLWNINEDTDYHEEDIMETVA